jgi:hypothetical protein
MLAPLLPFLASAVIKNISQLGHSEITITRTDLVFIDLVGKVAIFTNAETAQLSIGYRSSRNAYTDYFPISVPEFSASGISINIRTSLRSAHFQLWLLDQRVCPDVTNIAAVNTDRVLLLESGIDGPMCVFPRLNGAVYRIDVETGLGLPHISFFTARGRGESSKLCQGESDLCFFESTEPFFMVFDGVTRVNLTYRVESYRRPSPGHCSVFGIPTVRNGTLVDVLPRLTSPGQPWCMSKENGLVQAVIGLGLMLIAGGAAVVALRVSGKAGLKRLLAVNTGACCNGARETYESCF